MQIIATRIGQRVNLRKMQLESGLMFSSKDPMLVEYGSDKYFVISRYGTVVFWNFSKGEINEVVTRIADYITEKSPVLDEEVVEVEIAKDKRFNIKGGTIFIPELNKEIITLISIVLSRSIAIDHLENEIGEVSKDLEALMKTFAEKGKTSLSSKNLLKKVGVAMHIQHVAVNQMALLDKPDLTWDNAEMGDYYNGLVEEYELEDRYEILEDKLNILFRSVEFVIGYLDGKRSLMLEIIVILLILIEVLSFFYDKLML